MIFMDKRQKITLIILAIFIIIIMIGFIWNSIKVTEKNNMIINEMREELLLTQSIRVNNYSTDEDDDAVLIIVNSDTINDIIYLIINAKTKVQNNNKSDDAENYNLDFLDSDNNQIINLTSTTITYKEKYYDINYNYNRLLELIKSVE